MKCKVSRLVIDAIFITMTSIAPLGGSLMAQEAAPPAAEPAAPPADTKGSAPMEASSALLLVVLGTAALFKARSKRG